MADLAGLGHRQELEAVETVGVLTEIGAHHLGRLLLGLARLLEHGRLLAFELVGELSAALLGLLRLLDHAVERLAQVVVLDEARDLLAGPLRGHREPGYLAEFLFQCRQLCH